MWSCGDFILILTSLLKGMDLEVTVKVKQRTVKQRTVSVLNIKTFIVEMLESVYQNNASTSLQ